VKGTFFKRYRYKILIGRSFIIFILLFLCMNFSACTLFSGAKDFFTDKFFTEDEMDEVVGVVEAFFGLLMDKNYSEAYEYISSGDKLQGSLEDFSKEFINVTDIISIRINWVEIKSNIATVGIDLTDCYDGEEEVYRDMEVSLIKEEDNSWKIVFWEKQEEKENIKSNV